MESIYISNYILFSLNRPEVPAQLSWFEYDVSPLTKVLTLKVGPWLVVLFGEVMETLGEPD